MLYHLYDLNHAMLTPARWGLEWCKMFYQHPLNPVTYTQTGKNFAASAELFERVTRRFGKPVFGIDNISIGGKDVSVHETCLINKPFCTLMQFNRNIKRKDPKVLIVAPMSGHFSTLLRGTVKALLSHHDVYITDWTDARQVPISDGRFNLDDYISYIIEFLEYLGEETHVIAVCQPAVPVFAATAIMEKLKNKCCPNSITLMGGPIDTRVSKTAVNELAEDKTIDWFESSVVTTVPFYYPGAHRKVYPGFIQLGGFMSMNLDRHVGSHIKFYQHLVSGDGDSAASHRKFYNEYLSVMDISAEFYLQTVETVFQKHLLPRKKMIWTDPKTNKEHLVDPDKITKTPILTIEGEFDDISARGQTSAALGLCKNLPSNKKFHHLQKKVGHYGIFNGRRWREHIMPRIRHFIRGFDESKNIDPIPEIDLNLIPDKKPSLWDIPNNKVIPIKGKQNK
jgi:poly(3-hydroxybutyrate) depolymerase